MTRALAVAAVLLLGGAGPAHADRAHVDYMLHCQGCHLPDGRGSPDAVPDFVDHVGRFLEVPGGRAYLVQVPGSAHSPLDDAALAAVLNWIVRAFGPEAVARRFTPYAAAEVARHRATPLDDVAAVRAALLRRMTAP